MMFWLLTRRSSSLPFWPFFLLLTDKIKDAKIIFVVGESPRCFPPSAGSTGDLWRVAFLCRWTRLWKGHTVWEDSGKVWLHSSLIWRSAPRGGGLRLWQGQTAPGHHAEGRTGAPGKTENHSGFTKLIFINVGALSAEISVKSRLILT